MIILYTNAAVCVCVCGVKRLLDDNIKHQKSSPKWIYVSQVKYVLLLVEFYSSAMLSLCPGLRTASPHRGELTIICCR